MAEPVYQAGLLRTYKAELFSRMMVQARPGLEISYMDGIEGNPAEGIKPHVGQQATQFPGPEVTTPPYTPGARLVEPAGQRAGKSIDLAAAYTYGLGLPGSQFWHCANPFDNTARVFDYVWKWVVVDGVHGTASIDPGTRNSKDDKTIKLSFKDPEGRRKQSWLKCKSTDPNKGYQSLVGEQLDGVGWDECAGEPEKVWSRYLQPRLVNRNGWAAFISSPKDLNWFHRYWLRTADPEYQANGWYGVTFSMLDNPFIEAEVVEKLRDTMTKDEFEREVMGKFVSMSGSVFPDYRDELWPRGHLFDPNDWNGQGDEFRPTAGTVYRGIDIGISHPTACLWGSVQRDTNDIYVFHEYEEIRTTHDDHAREIASQTGWPVLSSFISPDAERKAATVSSRLSDNALRQYRRAGLFCRKAINDVSAGVSTVNKYMKSTLQDAPAEPRIFISKDCPKLRQALPAYVYVDQFREDRDTPKDSPKKSNDHIPDALRYLLASRPRWVSPAVMKDRDRLQMEQMRTRFRGGPQVARRGNRMGSVPVG